MVHFCSEIDDHQIDHCYRKTACQRVESHLCLFHRADGLMMNLYHLDEDIVMAISTHKVNHFHDLNPDSCDHLYARSPYLDVSNLRHDVSNFLLDLSNLRLYVSNFRLDVSNFHLDS